MNIGIAIRLIRKQLEVKQYELANLCGISKTSLSFIERGVKHPNTNTVLKLCKAFDTTETLIYMLSIEEKDIPEDKRNTYKLVYPFIVSLILKAVCDNTLLAQSKTKELVTYIGDNLVEHRLSA